MELTPRRRHVLSTALALLLAIESVTAVAAAARISVGDQGAPALPDASPAGLVLAESSAEEPTVQAPIAKVPADPVRAVQAPDLLAIPVDESLVAATPSVPALPARATMAERAPKAVITPPREPRPAVQASSGTGYAGRNHVWIPALKINRSVSYFPCSRTTAPGNYVYRWGCAGTNNVYLMGHASSVFRPLHDAYVAGRLKVGMKAWYADSNGKVRVYVVKWWRVTPPDGDVSWAYAAQATRSMTLQTCVGSDSAHRLVVRLVEANG